MGYWEREVGNAEKGLRGQGNPCELVQIMPRNTIQS